jgi:hypothetical protein
MPSYEILRGMVLVRTDVLEELRASINNVVPSSPIPVTLMIKAIRSKETLVLTRTTRRNIPVDGILHSRRREILKSYIALTGWTL